MTDTLTQEQIADIRARLNKRARGIWSLHKGTDTPMHEPYYTITSDLHLMTVASVPGVNKLADWTEQVAHSLSETQRATADFIANAPTDIAALLAALDAAQAENAALRKVAEAAEALFTSDENEEKYTRVSVRTVALVCLKDAVSHYLLSRLSAASDARFKDAANE